MNERPLEVSFLVFAFIALAFSGAVFFAGQAAAQPAQVITYHNDNLRSGWNAQETTLTATSFPPHFGVLATVTLDGQVNAQPLVVPGIPITSGPFAGTTHDVVYVATGGNTVYAIDASTGAILLSTNLGAPVPSPLGCGNNAPPVGITGTPAIDVFTKDLYVIAYVNGSPPIYQLHALSLSSLADTAGSPVTVAASHILTNGTTFTFNATYQRQRPGLLDLNNHIYAGFGGFCEPDSNERGWVLGWEATTLLPLPTNQLNDTQTTDPGVNPPIFMDSIWMSGYGISAHGTDLFFATANSDCNFNLPPGQQCPSTPTYDGKTNIPESVVSINSTLTGIVGIFNHPNEGVLNAADLDLGSGGVLLVNPPLSTNPLLAVAAGKTGVLFLLQQSASGGLSLADWRTLGACWCGPSYFIGPNGIGRIVTSQGSSLQTWQVGYSPTPHLTHEGTATLPASEQDPGFFTSVSSNGTAAGSAIIWAVTRPADPTTNLVTLYAFAAQASTSGGFQQLFSAPAGVWPFTGINANIVPVVANGKVYVASYQLLAIFGDTASAATAKRAANAATIAPRPAVSPDSPHAVSGTLLEVSGSTLTLTTRTGKTTKVDASQAIKDQRIGAPLKPGLHLTALGSSLNDAGVLKATAIIRAKGTSGNFWPKDH
jgi:PQQ enzyme repeat